MNRRFWDERLEALPLAQRVTLRDHRLRWQIRRCWEGSSFYRARLEAAGLDPATFGGLADLERIPVLRAEDLPREPALDHASRAWTVAPDAWWRENESLDGGVRRVLTDGDLVHRADLAARALWAAGARPNGTLTYWHAPDEAMEAGLRRISAQIRVGGGSRDSMLPVPPFVTSIVLHACEADLGLHWADDHLLAEVIDLESGSPVELGEAGALVVTDLTREGSPLIRHWTGLETALIDEPCPCGRTSARSPFVRPLA